MSDPSGTVLAPSVSRRPHPALRDFVTGYHGYRYELGEPGLHVGLPSTSLTMVLSFDRPIDVGWLAETGTRRAWWAMASGLSVDPAGIYHDGTQHGIQLDLTPLGSRALLGLPAATLHRELVSLSDILGARVAQLYDEVAAGVTWPARFAVLDDALLALAGSRPEHRQRQDATLTHAWQRVHASRGRQPIASLAADVGWSRRQLSQRFGAEFGIGPKQAARLVRFGNARPLVAAGRTPLADVAARCGYADQAHLTREWRQLAGATPTGWLRQERPFLQDGAGGA